MPSSLLRFAKLPACCLCLSCLLAHVHAETPLQITLGPGYTLDSSFAFGTTFAPVGSELTFSLLGEATGWAPTQTFSVVDGSDTVTIFNGPATTGAQARYVVRSGIGGVMFASNSGNPQQFAPGGADADIWVLTKNDHGKTTYAFAYEDFHYGVADDHNDMVVALSVSPAIPEPATFALMLAGLGVVGLRYRSRR